MVHNECALLVSVLLLEGIIFVLPLFLGALSMPARYSALRVTYDIDPTMSAAESLTGAARRSPVLQYIVCARKKRNASKFIYRTDATMTTADIMT